MKEFLEVLNLLGGTPIPIILVGAGIVFLFLAVGGRFGATVTTHEGRVKERTAAILGVTLLILGIALYIIPAIVTPKNETINGTPKSQEIAKDVIEPISGLYDDFNKSTNGGLNRELWTVREGELGVNAKVSQQDGVLVLSSDSNSPGQGIVLGLRKWLAPNFNTFEAKLKLSKLDSNGRSLGNNISINASLPTKGWTEMGLGFVGVGGEDRLANLNTTYDNWYIVRIKFDKDKRTLEYFLNDISVATYVIPGTSTVSLIPEIQLWHENGKAVEAFIDYVRIE